MYKEKSERDFLQKRIDICESWWLNQASQDKWFLVVRFALNNMLKLLQCIEYERNIKLTVESHWIHYIFLKIEVDFQFYVNKVRNFDLSFCTWLLFPNVFHEYLVMFLKPIKPSSRTCLDVCKLYIFWIKQRLTDRSG